MRTVSYNVDPQAVTAAINDGVDAIGGIVDELQLKNSNMTIFVANILPILNRIVETIDFNDALDAAAIGWSTPTSEVIVVDQYSRFVDPSGNPIGHYYWDHLHQTRAGQQRMAATWMKSLMDWRIEGGDYGGNAVQSPDLNANGVIDAGDMDAMISILNGPFDVNFDYDKDGDNDQADLKFFSNTSWAHRLVTRMSMPYSIPRTSPSCSKPGNSRMAYLTIQPGLKAIGTETETLTQRISSSRL